MPEESKTITGRLISARSEFAALTPDKLNRQFKGQDGKPTQYASLAACVKAVTPALCKHGLALKQTVDARLDPPSVSVRTLIVDASGGELDFGEIVLPVATVMQPAQGYGAAMTYAKRYGLLAACGIDTDLDAEDVDQQWERERERSRPQTRGQQPRGSRNGQSAPAAPRPRLAHTPIGGNQAPSAPANAPGDGARDAAGKTMIEPGGFVWRQHPKDAETLFTRSGPLRAFIKPNPFDGEDCYEFRLVHDEDGEIEELRKTDILSPNGSQAAKEEAAKIFLAHMEMEERYERGEID